MNKLRDGIIFALCAGVGLAIALALVVMGNSDGQVGKLQTTVSQLQAENQRLQGEDQVLTTEVTNDHATLAKIPAQAGTGQLGVCYSTTTQSFTGLYDSIMDGYAFDIGVTVSSPNLVNGVVSCPQGEQFVPVTPAKQ